MRRHDPDVIAALAEGRLDPDEAAAIEREISQDPIASAELEAQRTALAFLGSGNTAQLDDKERTALHASVADALGLQSEDPVPEPARRGTPWPSLGIAAAALAALVAVVPVVGLLSTGGSDDASLDLAAEAPTSTEAAELSSRSNTEQEAETVVGAADENDGLTAGDDAGSDAAGFGSSTTLPPATTVPTAEASEPPPTTAAPAAATQSSPPTSGVEGFEQLTEELSSLRDDPTGVGELARTADESATCWVEDTDIRADPPPERFVFDYEHGELTVIVYYEVENGELGPFQVWGVPDCADLVVIGEPENP